MMTYTQITQAITTDNPPANLVEELTNTFHATFPDLTYEQAKAMLTVVGLTGVMSAHPKRKELRAAAREFAETQTQDNNKLHQLLVIAELMSLWTSIVNEMRSDLIQQLVKRN